MLLSEIHKIINGRILTRDSDFVEVKWSILSDAKTWAEAKRRMTATDAKK
jgi:hypothetical protein